VLASKQYKENVMAKRRKQAQPKAVSDQLRWFIRESELSRNQICKLTGLDPSHLHRFVHGTGRLTNDTIDKLAAALKLRLTQD
jgi:plasmid maintenance system antidote protein VapI